MRLALVAYAALCATTFAAATVDVSGARIAAGAAPVRGTVQIVTQPRIRRPPRLPTRSLRSGIPYPPVFQASTADLGSGLDGAFVSAGEQVLPGGAHEYTTFEVPTVGHVVFSGDVEISATESIRIEGTMRVLGSLRLRSQSIEIAGATDTAAVYADGGIDLCATSATQEPALTISGATLTSRRGDITASALPGPAVGSSVIAVHDGVAITAALGTVNIATPGEVTLANGANLSCAALAIRSGSVDLAQSALLVGTRSTAILAIDKVALHGPQVEVTAPQVSISAFSGDIAIQDRATVSAGSEGLTCDSGRTLTLSGEAQLRVLHAGALSLSSLDELQLGSCQLAAGPGGIHLNALNAIRLTMDASLSTTGRGPVRGRASHGLVSCSGYVNIASTGAFELSAATSLTCDDGGTGYFPDMSGSSVRFFSGTESDIHVDSLNSTAGGVTVLSGGRLALGGIWRSYGPGRYTAADGDIDIAGAVLWTTDAGPKPSASISLDSYSASPTIIARNAVVKTGTSQSRSGSIRIRVWNRGSN